LFIPDARIGWYKYAVKAGIKAIQDDPSIKVVLSSGPPHTVHLIGHTIAKRTGLPFVADFRDPWLNIDYYHDIKRSRFTLSIDRYLEGKILTHADAVTVVSPGCLDLLIEGHKNIDLDRFHVIYNGFDAEVYPDPAPQPPGDKFIITYIGNMPQSRYTPVLYQAISELKREGKISSEKFQLQFFGNIHHDVRQELQGFQIDDLLQMNDFVPHQTAIMKICQSHLLLLVINNTRTRNAIVTGKLFEYLASRRPIIAIGPTDGDAAKILCQTGTGSIFEYDDASGIKDFLFRDYQKFQQDKWQPIAGAQIDKYNRSSQLKQLFEVFEKVSS
ncbi:MAG TPA: glycosyltransferase, partial [bacterium]